jgi:hypothetical protein
VLRERQDLRLVPGGCGADEDCDLHGSADLGCFAAGDGVCARLVSACDAGSYFGEFKTGTLRGTRRFVA